MVKVGSDQQEFEMWKTIYEKDGKWYFWDGTKSQRCGPFPSKERAELNFSAYCQYLNTGQSVSEIAREMAAETVSENAPEFYRLWSKLEDDITLEFAD